MISKWFQNSHNASIQDKSNTGFDYVKNPCDLVPELQVIVAVPHD